MCLFSRSGGLSGAGGGAPGFIGAILRTGAPQERQESVRRSPFPIRITSRAPQ